MIVEVVMTVLLYPESRASNDEKSILTIIDVTWWFVDIDVPLLCAHV